MKNKKFEIIFENYESPSGVNTQYIMSKSFYEFNELCIIVEDMSQDNFSQIIPTVIIQKLKHSEISFSTIRADIGLNFSGNNIITINYSNLYPSKTHLVMVIGIY